MKLGKIYKRRYSCTAFSVLRFDDDSDFEDGSLRKRSNVRPNGIFTADSKIILYKAGHIKSSKIDEVVNGIIEILTHLLALLLNLVNTETIKPQQRFQFLGFF